MQPFNIFHVRNSTIIVRFWTVFSTLLIQSPKGYKIS